MKILDLACKGNVVRFYLGADHLEEWCGKGWDKTPYENNADCVDGEFIKGVHDIAFGFDDRVIEPWHDPTETWSKEDLRDRQVPALIIIPRRISLPATSYRILTRQSHLGVLQVYFGDQEDLLANLVQA